MVQAIGSAEEIADQVVHVTSGDVFVRGRGVVDAVHVVLDRLGNQAQGIVLVGGLHALDIGLADEVSDRVVRVAGGHVLVGVSRVVRAVHVVGDRLGELAQGVVRYQLLPFTLDLMDVTFSA